MYKKVALSVLAAAAAVSASDVTQLKGETFDDFIATNDLVLAECKFPSSEVASIILSELWLISVRNSLRPLVVSYSCSNAITIPPDH
jgi:hypothetical protein